jgi:hypothetical protein
VKFTLVNAAVALAFCLVLIFASAGGCNSPSGDKFSRDCKDRGGHVGIHTVHGKTSKVCLPPAGGWQ